MRGDELLGVAQALAREATAAREAQAALATRLAELKRVYQLVDAIAAHVNAVEASVAALEVAVNESTAAYNKQALKRSLGAVTGWFTSAAAPQEMPPFERPAASHIDTDAFVQRLRQ